MKIKVNIDKVNEHYSAIKAIWCFIVGHDFLEYDLGYVCPRCMLHIQFHEEE